MANDTVLLGYLVAVVDLDEASLYDWVYAIFASLYHGLDIAVTTRESARDARRLQELTDENATLRRYLDSVDKQLYEHDLHLRRGLDVRVVQLPAGGGARMRQRGSGLRTRGGGTSRRSRVLEMIE
ncbi:hypothetical protein GIB67_016629 [Kingdonia uniflora]|uniref:Uncharacterized protein n=1 Tax=Kingdonia uniflora TaxID=39325 RepID=A0A7J7MZ74_9MAGN|nr:hypothetical protein GIB67_016629 [Kingdonia uniflora]